MFTDEIYEDILINKNGKVTTAHEEVYKQKMGDYPDVVLKQIENGYQLFRKRHPEYPEDSFRRFCFVRLSQGGQNILVSRNLFANLKWAIKPEYLTIGQ